MERTTVRVLVLLICAGILFLYNVSNAYTLSMDSFSPGAGRGKDQPINVYNTIRQFIFNLMIFFKYDSMSAVKIIIDPKKFMKW